MLSFYSETRYKQIHAEQLIVCAVQAPFHRQISFFRTDTTLTSGHSVQLHIGGHATTGCLQLKLSCSFPSELAYLQPLNIYWLSSLWIPLAISLFAVTVSLLT